MKLLREYVSLDYKGSIMEEAKKAKADNGPLLVPALLQRASVPNQNERIYDKAILEREVNNYQNLIEGRRSGGELDHPDSCLTAEYQLLTRDRGWQYIGEVCEGEYILTLNPETDELEAQPVQKKTVAHYKKDLYRLKGRSFFAECTDNHRWFIKDRNHKGFFVKTCELAKFDSHYHIPKKATWKGTDPEYFELPGVDNLPNVKIEIENWCAFLGLYLSEGHCAGTKGGRKTNKVGITQVYNQDKVQKLLDKLPFDFKKENTRQFCCSDKRLHSYLFDFGNSHQKYIPQEVKSYSSRLLSILYEWLMFGDGTKVISYHDVQKEKRGYGAHKYASTSVRLADDIQEILLKINKSGNIHAEERGDREIEGRKILAENSKPMNIVHVSSTNGTYLGNGLKIETVPFDGMVYCVSVPNEIFYVRHDKEKYPTWTGNSVVSLQNVSHMIKEIWWEDNDVKGIVEIHPSLPKGQQALGLLEAGLKVGISSRGVGETQTNEDGFDVVDESFMLIAFDLVSEPSTHEAWLMREGKNIDANEIRKAISKRDRISRMIREILGR